MAGMKKPNDHEEKSNNKMFYSYYQVVLKKLYYCSYIVIKTTDVDKVSREWIMGLVLIG